MGNRLAWIIMVTTLMILPGCVESPEGGVGDTVNPDSPPATSTTTTLPVQTQGEEAPITCTSYGYYIPSEGRSVIGGRTYFRHDGVCRPESEINLASGDWAYLVVEGDTYYNLSRKNKTLRIPKKSWLNWGFGFDKITLDFQANSMAQLVDRSNPYNSTCRYVKIGQASTWKKLAKVNWHGDFGWSEQLSISDSGTNVTNSELNITYLNISYFDNSKAGFHVVNDKLYFLECDNSWFQNAVYPVTFRFNSYIINGSGGNTTWDSGSHSNTVVKKATDEVQLDWEVNDWISYWTFDDNFGSTTATDESGTNDGTLQNMEYDEWVGGKYGNALAFDTGNEYIDCGNDSSLNFSAFTMMAWVNLSSYVNFAKIICHSDSDSSPTTGAWFSMYGTANYPDFLTGTGSGYSRVTALDIAVLLTNYTHLTVWFNGSLMRIYGNGIPSATTDTNTNYVSEPTKHLHIAGTTFYLNGMLDDIRIFNHPITPTEINQSRDNEHKSTGNYTTVEVNAGSGKSVKNATITFTSNGQTTDLWSNCSGSWTEHHTGITSGTNYDISGTEQNCSLITEFTTSNISKTPEVEKIEVWYAATADTTKPTISNEAINDTEIAVNESIKLNCTVTDNTAVDIVKFFIEPFGNITATDADPEFYIICDKDNPCNTTVEGQYNWTWVWANDTTNNINSTVVTLNYTVVTTTTTTTTTTVPLHLAFQTPTPANDTTITVNHVEVNISVENLSNPLDTFIFSWNNTNMTLRNFNCSDKNMSFINDGEGGFCIDKYEASCWNSDGSWNSTSATDEWRAVNTTAALTGGAYAGSSPGKYPWVYISQTQARTACENAGKQLCTSEQWLAAANINGTFYDLPETITDCNVVSGSPAECQNTGPAGGDACNTSYMSDCVSEEGVYDMVGNVWEWSNESFTVVIPLATDSWHYINTINLEWSLSATADNGRYGDDGCYFGTAGTRAVLRGGAWNYEANAGPFSVLLHLASGTMHSDIGFRCCAAPNDPSDVPSTWENITEVYHDFTPVKIASSLIQYNSSEWRFYYNETNILNGTYTYYGWANDTTGNFNQSETRTITLGVIAEIEDAVETILNVIRWGWD